MPTLGQRAQAIVDLVKSDGGPFATTDPQEAASNRPCVLVGPPDLDFTAGTYAGPLTGWRLVALSAQALGTVEALDELERLVEAVLDVLPIETARPGRYPLGSDIVPAYVITLND